MRSGFGIWALLAACAAGNADVAATEPAPAPPSVRIAQGVIAGAAVGEVEHFFNIPFAAAPTGALRWRAPGPAPRWQGVRDAARFGPACPQPMRPALVAGGVADNQSEDCLQLNIWRPKSARKLPVMVWVHGGANILGSGTFPAFDGSAFARQDVILVTINYRLGALGFFAHPALTAEARRGEAFGNYAMMDQLAALRWVKKNIAAFGGDPKQVTLFGESAGAIAVSTLLANPEAKGLFARAIVQSGVGLLDPRTLAEQEALGTQLAERAGAGPAATPAVLRALSVEVLLAAPTDRAAGMVAPFIDGRLIREAPWRVLARSEPIDVPLMVGANSNEASVILAMGVPPAAARAYVGADTTAATAAYGADLPEDEFARQVLGDAWFVAPARWLAERTQAGAPSYLYHFDYVAAARRARAKGAAHGSEIPYVFGTLDYLAALAPPVEAEDRAFSDALISCWASFAKSGAPMCALVPDWPRYESGTDNLALFAPQSQVVRGFRKQQLDLLLRVHAKAYPLK